MDNQEKRIVKDDAEPIKVSKSTVDKVRKNQKTIGRHTRSFAKIGNDWYEITNVPLSKLFIFTKQKNKHLHEQTDLL